MKIIFLLFAVLAVVSAYSVPSRVATLTVQIRYDNTGAPLLFRVEPPDMENAYKFYDILGFTEEEVQKDIDAMDQWYYETYGIDFRTVEIDATTSCRSLDDVGMMSCLYAMNPDDGVDNYVRWYESDKYYNNRVIGLNYIVTNPDGVMLYGKWGGEEGTLAPANSWIEAGWHVFVDEDENLVDAWEYWSPFQGGPMYAPNNDGSVLAMATMHCGIRHWMYGSGMASIVMNMKWDDGVDADTVGGLFFDSTVSITWPESESHWLVADTNEGPNRAVFVPPSAESSASYSSSKKSSKSSSKSSSKKSSSS